MILPLLIFVTASSELHGCVLPIISNGQVKNTEEPAVGEELIIKCADNYKTNPSSGKVRCTDDGSYSPTPSCTAKNCDVSKAPEIVNGMAEVKDYAPGDTITFTCDKGYILSHNNPVKCVTAIVYDYAFPSCLAQNCKKDDIKVVNGVITGPDPIVPGSTLIIQCNTGYKRNEKIIITCVTTEKIDNESNLDKVCEAQDCDTADVDIENGRVEVIKSVNTIAAPGEAVTVVCDDNYDLKPDDAFDGKNSKCVTADKYDPPLATCQAVPCPKRDVKNGLSKETQPGSALNITCFSNYELSDTQTFRCLSKELFSPQNVSLPTCEAKDCVIEPIDNGQLEGSQTLKRGEVTTLQCGEKYDLVGDKTITCVAGKITVPETLPSCEARPCENQTIANATITAETVDGVKYKPGAVLTIACNVPYAKNIETEIRCITDDVFSSVLPKCIKVNCINQTITNGRITGPSSMTPGAIILVQCDRGYKLTNSGGKDAKCFSSNEFDPPLPTCETQRCTIPVITNGESEPANGEKLDPGGSVAVTCKDNYLLVGSSNVVCVTGSVFTPGIPTCTAQPCKKSDMTRLIGEGTIGNPGTEIDPEVEIEINCNTDYKKSNPTAKPKCISNKLYDPPELIKCVGYPCNATNHLPPVSNGSYTKGEFNAEEQIIVTCDNNYTEVKGTPPATCKTRDKFDGQISTCAAVNCVIPYREYLEVENDKNNIKSGDVVKMKCTDGRKLSTTSTITCFSKNKFSEPFPRCEEQNCPAPPIQHGETSKTEYGPGDVVTVTCDTNYKRGGGNYTCESGSKLTTDAGGEPTCNPTNCLEGDYKISNGQITASGEIRPGEIRPGEVISITCNDGYKLSSTNPVTCVTRFDPDPKSLPSCIDKECVVEPPPSNGNLTPERGPYDPGVTITLTCKDGYKQGDSTVVTFECERYKTFNPAFKDCSAQQCNPPKDENGDLDPKTLIAPGTTVTVKCDSNYEISDTESSKVVTCVTDTYYDINPFPKCKAKKCPKPSLPNGDVLHGAMLTPGEIVKIQCNDGYVISNSSVKITCKANVVFETDTGATVMDITNSVKCNPRACYKRNIRIDKGSVNNMEANIDPGTVITIICNKGYNLTGSTDVTCVTRLSDDENVYSSTLPTCEPNNCNKPDIPNSSIVVPIKPGKDVLITCNAGYTLIGDGMQCVTADEFIGEKPKCIKNCNKADLTIPGGEPASTDPDQYKPNEIVNIKCNGGFKLIDDSEEVRCETDKTFKPQPIQGCQAVNCVAPQKNRILHAESIGPANLKPGETLTVLCDGNYAISSPVITCVSDYVFNPKIEDITCNANECSVKPIENSEKNEKTTLTPNEEQVITCKKGYYLSTTSPYVCIAGEKFSLNETPSCQPRNCILPDIPGVESVTPINPRPGDVLTITCSNGREPTPKGQYKCVTENEFSRDENTFLIENVRCEAVNCSTSGLTIANSVKVNEGQESIAPNEVVTFECDPNYETVEKVTVFCVSGAVYSAVDPETELQCKAVDCYKPIILNGIVTTLDKIIPGSELELKCGDGYDTPTQYKFRCVSKNKFDVDVLPECQAVDCNPPNIANGIVTSGLKPDSNLTIQCGQGYELDTNTTFKCVTSNIFNPNSKMPECKPKLCDKTTIERGSITGPTPITPNSNITVQCTLGYTLDTFEMPKCIHTSVFRPAVNTIKCVKAADCTLSAVRDGVLGQRVLKPGYNTTLTCNKGFTPRAHYGLVYCVVGNIVYPDDYGCRRSECQKPEVVNGIVRNTVVYHDDALEIACFEGYVYSGSSGSHVCVEGKTYKTSIPVDFTITCIRVTECPVPVVANGKVVQSRLPVNTALDILCNTGYYNPYNSDVMCNLDGSISRSNLECLTCNAVFDNTDGFLSSPFFGGGTYPSQVQCTYTIKARPGNFVEITIESIDMEFSEGCTKDSLSFYDGSSTSDPLLLKTCGEAPRKKRAVTTVKGSTSVMTIVFISDGSGSGQGYRLGYAPLPPPKTNKVLVIVLAVVIPVIIILIILALIFVYCRFFRPKDNYDVHRNFRWNEGGTIDNAYFHYIANGGRKPPPTLQEKLQAASGPDFDNDSIVSSNSRAVLTASQPLAYSTIKLGLQSNLQSPHTTIRSVPVSNAAYSPSPASRSRQHTPAPGNNYNTQDNKENDLYSHKKALEGLGLTERDFKLNIPYNRYNNLSGSGSESSFTRTALEDTLDGDPLQHTNLTQEVLASPETMRALEKYRAGARKHTKDNPNSEGYEMRSKNRAISERNLQPQREAYDAGYRRPLPPKYSHI